MLECQSHTCKTELSRVLDQKAMAECNTFMHKIKEDRHFKTFECQKAKLERLLMKDELKNKGGHSKVENMQRYMYQSSTNSSRTTASTSTATSTTITGTEIQDQQLFQQWLNPNGSSTCLRNHSLMHKKSC